MKAVIVIVCFLTLVSLACASASSTPGLNKTFTDTPISSDMTIPSASSTSRCVQASSIQTNNILVGVKGVDSNNIVKDAWAVKSNDFNNVWMVAAYIYGPGMEDGAGPGVWAMNGDPDEQGITMSVDSFAKSFSDWPDASTTDAAISQFDDGVKEAQICAQDHK